MVTKREILAKINEAICDNNGSAVTLKSTLADANLDNFGLVMAMAVLDSEFHFLEEGNVPSSETTILIIVKKCLTPIVNIVKLSSLN